MKGFYYLADRGQGLEVARCSHHGYTQLTLRFSDGARVDYTIPGDAISLKTGDPALAKANAEAVAGKKGLQVNLAGLT